MLSTTYLIKTSNFLKNHSDSGFKTNLKFAPPPSFRCLELQPNNLKALMALAVSYTNTGHQQDACEALKNWIKQNPKYKYLVKSKKGSPGLTRRMSKSPVDRYPSH